MLDPDFAQILCNNGLEVGVMVWIKTLDHATTQYRQVSESQAGSDMVGKQPWKPSAALPRVRSLL